MCLGVGHCCTGRMVPCTPGAVVLGCYIPTVCPPVLLQMIRPGRRASFRQQQNARQATIKERRQNIPTITPPMLPCALLYLPCVFPSP